MIDIRDDVIINFVRGGSFHGVGANLLVASLLASSNSSRAITFTFVLILLGKV